MGLFSWVKTLFGQGPDVKECVTFRPPVAPPPDAIAVTFLGVSGLLIRWQGQSLLTPPLYSNPTLGELLLSDFYPDTERVDRFLRDDLKDVQAVFVGHSHYDHALDVPYIALKKTPPGIPIYGSRTLVNVLAPLVSELGANNPLVEVESQALGQVPGPAKPIDIPGGRFRVWSILSEHAPQLGPHVFPKLVQELLPIETVAAWRGQLLAPAKTLPTRVGRWPCGTTLSYLIELHEVGKPVFRIYYQDAATRKPIGYPPGTDPVDLAVLCMGGTTELPDFPRDIVETVRPRFVMGSHWEDFFKPRDLPLPGQTNVEETIPTVAGLKLKRFTKAVKAALPTGGQMTIPCPENVAFFTRDAGGWRLDPKSTGTWTSPKP
jgi:Beta-lactamase superfamily domain